MPEEKTITWADYVKHLLAINGWTHEQLANKIGCHPSLISHWVAGRHEPSGPSRTLLLQLGGD